MSQSSKDISVTAVRRASGWASALLIIALLSGNLLSYAVWGLDRLLFDTAGIHMEFQLYQICAGLLPTVLSAVFAALAARKLTGYRVRKMFADRPKMMHPGTIFLGFGLCLGLNLVTSFLTELFTKWLNEYGAVIAPPNFSYSSDTPLWSGMLVLYSCLIAPLVEEIIFRGYILRLLRRFGTGFAILFSALLFALYHYDFTQMLPTFVMGCFFGYMAVRYESILPVIGVHVLNNVVAVSLSTFSPGFSPEAMLFIDIILYAVALISLVVTLSIYRKGFPKLREPVLVGQLTKGKAFAAAMTSPVCILLFLIYLYQVISKIIV